jgi:adenosylcobinamide-phosphate synthase
MDWPVLVFSRAAAALLIERFTGYPQAIHSRISHPVVWAGKLIDYLDQRLNKPGVGPAEGRIRGVAALAVLIAAAFFPAYVIAGILSSWRLGWLVEVLLATTLIAQRSLKDHVLDVHAALTRSLPEARKAVSLIVGRDPSRLDESGVSRAALESLAENSVRRHRGAHPVVCAAGPSRHRRLQGDQHGGFDDRPQKPEISVVWMGFCAARRPRQPARLAPHRPALRRLQPLPLPGDRGVMRRDAPKHQSPNAGWPEAAMAAALGLRFGGPRSYQGETVDLPWMGEGRTALTRADIMRGIKLMQRAMLVVVFCVAVRRVFVDPSALEPEGQSRRHEEHLVNRAASFWLAIPCSSRKRRAMAFSGTMESPTSFETRTTLDCTSARAASRSSTAAPMSLS